MSDPTFTAYQQNTPIELNDVKPEAPEQFDNTGFASPVQRQIKLSPNSVEVDGLDLFRGKMIHSSALLTDSRNAIGLKQGHTSALVNNTADLFAVLNQYEPEFIPEELCEHKEFRQFLDEFVKSEDYSKLHRRTMFNSALSSVAAAESMQAYYRLVKQQEQETTPPTPEEQQKQMQQAAASAATQAVQSADEAQEVGSMLGAGSEHGTGGTFDPDMLQELYHQYRNNPPLKNILQAAGKYMVVAKSMQRQCYSEDPEEISDITVAGSIERLIPSELAMLVTPETEDEMIRKILEKHAVCYQWDSPGEKQAGPIMVFCDESGSMSGERIVEAKAVSLVMAWIAIHQNRWCHLVGFCTGSHFNEVTLCPKESAASRAQKTIKWLNHFYNGGTDVRFLEPEKIEKRFQETGAPRGETDILMLTDADIYQNEYIDMAPGFAQWKEANDVRMISIGIGCRQKPLPELSDASYSCDVLSEDSEAVKAAFSVNPQSHHPQQEATP